MSTDSMQSVDMGRSGCGEYRQQSVDVERSSNSLQASVLDQESIRKSGKLVTL